MSWSKLKAPKNIKARVVAETGCQEDISWLKLEASPKVDLKLLTSDTHQFEMSRLKELEPLNV